MNSSIRVALMIAAVVGAGCAEPEKETVIVYVTPDAAVSEAGSGADAGGPDAPGSTAVPSTEIPFYQAWLSSAHADKGAEAFAHWNMEGVVPQSCAKR